MPALAGALLFAAVRVQAQSVPEWPDTFLSRVEMLAIIQSLNADILGSRSATATLEQWCGEHHLATQARIVARLVKTGDKPASAEQRRRLEAPAPEPIRYRHVQLLCGRHVLSEADNWYVPNRLTADMNRLLDTTDTPFGRVVQPLAPYRETFEVRQLWSPLGHGWERTAPPPPTSGILRVPAALFEHRAVLFTRDHKPFSEVDEVYQRDVVAFPPPPAEQ